MWYNKSYGAKLHYANEFCFAKLNKVISKAMEQSSAHDNTTHELKAAAKEKQRLRKRKYGV